MHIHLTTRTIASFLFTFCLVLSVICVIDIHHFNTHYTTGYARLDSCNHTISNHYSECTIHLECACFAGNTKFVPKCENVLNGSCLTPTTEQCKIKTGRHQYTNLPMICDQVTGLFRLSCFVNVSAINQFVLFNFSDTKTCEKMNQLDNWGECGTVNGELVTNNPNADFSSLFPNQSVAVGLLFFSIILIIGSQYTIYHSLKHDQPAFC